MSKTAERPRDDNGAARRTTPVLSALLAALLFTLLAGCGAAQSSPAADETARLQEAFTAAEAETSALRDMLDAAEEEATALRDRLAAAEGEAASLQERLSDAETALAALEADAAPERLRRAVAEHHSLNAHPAAVGEDGTRLLPYLLYEPGVESAEPLPLLVYLHGIGGRGTDPERIFTENSLPNLLRSGALTPNALVLIPQCPAEENWYMHRRDLMTLIDAVAEQYGADRARISVTGYSMGGIGCFALLTEFPDRFAAAAPYAATYAYIADCARITGTPVRIFHGSDDEGMGMNVVEIDRVIRNAGGQSVLVLYSGEGHSIQHHYADDDCAIVDWLIGQTRSSGQWLVVSG